MQKKIFYGLLYFFLPFGAMAQNCGKWIMGYLPTYEQEADGSIPFLTPTDYQKLSHLMSFGPYVKSDGSFDLSINTTTATRLTGAVNAAHSNS